MSVLREILSWSKSCPTWQRDALRRLVQNGTLLTNDFSELTLICQSKHGLFPPETPVPANQPLSEEHLPPDVQSNQAVALAAVEAVQHVNALTSKQPLAFGSIGLTVVYGDNASGKSGYVRILKCACRTRSRSKRILADVFSVTANDVASATIKFKVGSEDAAHAWQDGESIRSPLGLVSVFDSACALHYVEEANDVAFRPFGLDLLDKLASACTHLKKGFDQERTSLLAAAKDFTDLKGSTDVGRLIESLTAQTAVVAVERLANLSPQESEKLENLKRQVAQIEAEDPAVRARELKGRATRLEAMRQRLNEIQSTLSEDGIQVLKAALSLANSTAEAAKLASESAFKDEPPPLNGVASETWKELWEAARRYSETEAYPDSPFPDVSEGARCVLCQQLLTHEHDTGQRLSRFESFVKAETQKAAEAAKERFKKMRETFVDQTEDLTAPDDLLTQLDLTHQICATKIRSFLESAVNRKADVAAALASNDWTAIRSLIECPVADITTIVTDLNTKSAEFERAKAPEKLAELKAERDQLLARQKLGQRKADVLAEIARLKRLNALAACLRDVDTTATSRKSTELTKSRVTKTICDRFKTELNGLGLAHLRVELVPAGSERGVMYHRVELQGTSASVQDIASEGEYRCVALAGFLAELATATHKSALVFDDPVSSLDHTWRASLAHRLVLEAKDRQVIVFTHDPVFLIFLLEQAEKAGVPVAQTHLTRGSGGSSGVCNDGPPWLAMPVKSRIGALKAQWQQAEKLQRTEGPVVYEALAKELYGRLRETWERAVEEVLLNGAIVRFGRNIETQKLKKITDTTAADIQTIDAAMAKCSTHFRGHDQAPAINQPVPAPVELQSDIQQLEDWVTQIRKRRG